jgi:hypothetical protein
MRDVGLSIVHQRGDVGLYHLGKDAHLTVGADKSFLGSDGEILSVFIFPGYYTCRLSID